MKGPFVVLEGPEGAGKSTVSRLLTDWLIRLDPVNPQTAARMSGAFETWRRFGPTHRMHAQAALRRIADTPDLSRNTAEMVARIAGD